MNNKVKFLRGTSDEYAIAEKDSDTIYFTTDDGKLYIGDKEVSGSDMTIDDTLSDTSTNPVQGNVIKQAIDNKADVSEIPTKVSELENDSGYLTEHQDLSEYAKTADIPTKVSQLENDSGYLTEHPHINEKPGPTTITSLRFGDSFDSVEQIVTDGNGHIQEVHNQTLTLPNILIENSLDIHSSGLLTNKTITAALNEKADTTHTHSVDEIGADSRGSAAAALSEAKTYTDNAVADLINGAPTTRDTLKEISDLMDENASVVEALDAAIGTKANKTDIPTKTSELENDSGFLTEHQDLSEYAKSTDVNAALTNKADVSHTHDEYASIELYSKTGINFGRKRNTLNGYKSTAEGNNTTASGNNSHAEGLDTTASNYASHVSGKYNAAMTAGGSSINTTGTAFVIGNGTDTTALSNAFSVQYDGTVKAKSTITASTTADYAEFFEWLDGNPDSEDRVGYFVTLDGNKVKIASHDDFILGVVSGEPFVLGNGDCDVWNGMFLRDEFRRTIYEPAPKMEEILDDEGNPTGEFKEIEGEFEGTRPKLNPEYDHTKTYISRFDRPEWSPVGMLGVLAVRHDGTAKVNGYVTVADGGIATACDKNAENSYRVIKANSDSVVEIIFR